MPTKEELENQLLELEIEEKKRPIYKRPKTMLAFVTLAGAVVKFGFDAEWAKLEAQKQEFKVEQLERQATERQTKLDSINTEIETKREELEDLEAAFEETTKIARARDEELTKTTNEYRAFATKVAGTARNPNLRSAAESIKNRNGKPALDPKIYESKLLMWRTARRDDPTAGPDPKMDKLRRHLPLDQLLKSVKPTKRRAVRRPR